MSLIALAISFRGEGGGSPPCHPAKGDQGFLGALKIEQKNNPFLPMFGTFLTPFCLRFGLHLDTKIDPKLTQKRLFQNNRR